MRLLLCVVSLWGVCQGALLVREPEPPAPRSRNDPQEGYITMPLDNFHASNTDTWQMRYYYNSEFAPASDAPYVLILVGGEWSISPSWLTAGLMYEMAQHIGAAMFYTEHRYYGLSRPTSDTSSENLRWLNVDQALADLAIFIDHVTSGEFENGRYRGARVGLVGCSYAGSMATWMRVAYPHLVAAAFSTSGPLHAQEDFPEYLEVISSALETQGSAACVAAVQESMELTVALLQEPGGADLIADKFDVCGQLDPSNPLDLASFFWYGITETFAYLVQYHVPGTIPAACQALTDPALDPVDRLAAWVRSQRYSCIESRYAEVLAAHTNTSYDAPDSVMRLWTYQTCVEYGWYQTTNSERQPFLSVVPLEYFHQQCTDFFGTSFDPELLRSGIERTNIFFGGLSQLPERVVSVGGGDDPWSPVGPITTSDPVLSPVYMVPASSHCRAMRSSFDNESEEMAWAKNQTIVHMITWLQGEQFYLDGFNAAPRWLPLAILPLFAFINTILYL